ncbi:D-lyxose ketol-isomerase [Anoxybacillus sp. B7M1]|jgi:D-lyxose ketol-isomerase|uniref:D-lyxose/D-mannose family sugar isomerase n=1 Tax=unclassified Anoxybacillus TaxID=2639704 RepID=UPI0005CCA715|nr:MULTISPECIES: D-lyxose/D-mannose family sugar isomerase [unclassified Anoxybacillus]ANB56170.1 D-lyxose ketol-isomerase [Anoxybacillus sp. B2M1]ANB62620.1 D-lyxose ketol-isomerase [Anoxybacillus sp. B7M1]
MKEQIKEKVLRLLEKVNIVLTEEEKNNLEITDLGLGNIEIEGLQIVTYMNNERYCAKELILLPNQTCPEHLHPPIHGEPGKKETFRCRWGVVHLFVEGEETKNPLVSPPKGKEEFYTAKSESVLYPGQQFTIPPGVKHWFKAGNEGAIVSEFSSTSRDEFDIFTDPNVQRV